MNKTLFARACAVLIAFAVVSIAAPVAAQQFREPTVDFPGGNPALPLDTSDIEQTKLGNLKVGDGSIGESMKLTPKAVRIGEDTNRQLRLTSTSLDFWNGGTFIGRVKELANALYVNMKGLVLPNTYTTTDITAPQKGTIIFDKANNKVQLFDGTKWGPISGSITGGTPNYVPLWKTTTELTTSNLFQKNLNIGIGTEDPKTKLEVLGGIKIVSPVGGQNYLEMGSGASDSKTGFGLPYTFANPPSTDDTCDANVTNEFVCGATVNKTCVDVVKGTYTPPGGSNQPAWFKQTVSCVYPDEPLYKLGNAAGSVNLINNKNEVKMSLTQDGTAMVGNKLGVGITPQYGLDVKWAGDKVAHFGDETGNDITMDISAGQGLANVVAGARLKTDNTVNPAVTYYEYTGTRGASRIKMHDDAIEFYIASSTDVHQDGNKVSFRQIMAINNNNNVGNVGIGRWGDPKYKLDVNGIINANSVVVHTAGGGLCIDSDCRTSWSAIGSGSGWQEDAANNKVYLINPTRNVGVGTTDPKSKLSVLGSVSLLRPTGNNISAGPGPAIALQSPSNNVSGENDGWKLCGGTNPACPGDTTPGNDAVNAYACKPADTGKTYTDVGTIPLSNPAQKNYTKITCVAGTDTYSLRTNSGVLEALNSGNTARMTLAQDGTFKVGGATGLTVAATGKVGVGGAPGTDQLNVTGDVNITGIYKKNGQPFSGSKWLDTVPSGGIYYTGGKVGIGTDKPSTDLHTRGTITHEVWKAQDTAGLNLVTLGDGKTSLNSASPVTKGWALGARGNAYITAGEQNDLVLSYWDGAYIDTSVTPNVKGKWYSRMFFDHEGKVGLGKTPGNYALDVLGPVNASSVTARADGGFCIGASCIKSWSEAGSASGWTEDAANKKVYTKDTAYKVGIGTNAPNEKLTVWGGNVRILHDPANSGFEYVDKGTVANGHISPSCACDLDANKAECGAKFVSADVGAMCWDRSYDANRVAPLSKNFSWKYERAPGGSVINGGVVYANNSVVIGSPSLPSDHKPGISLSPSQGKSYTVLNNKGTLEFVNGDGQTKAVMDQAGGMGIGTGQPGAGWGANVRLDVRSNALTSGQVDWSSWVTANATVQAANGAGTGIKFQQGSNTTTDQKKWAGIAGVAEADWSNKVGLAFYTSNAQSTGPTEKMRITNDGKVGFGTAAPQAQVHIVPSVNGMGLLLDKYSDSEGGEIVFNGKTKSWRIDEYQGSLRFLRSAGNLGPFESTDVSISPIGNVGIGKLPNAAYKLDVSGGIHGGSAAFTDLSVTNNIQAQNLYLAGAATRVYYYVKEESVPYDKGFGPESERLACDLNPDANDCPSPYNQSVTASSPDVRYDKVSTNYTGGNYCSLSFIDCELFTVYRKRSDTVTTNGTVDAGELKIRGKKPFIMLSFSNSQGQVFYETNVPKSDYRCMTTGFRFWGGDFNEGPQNGTNIDLRCVNDSNPTWQCGGDMVSKNQGEKVYVDVFCVNNALISKTYP